MKFNANYEPNSKIMFLNERQLFNTSSKGLNKTFQKEKISDKYIMPIAIEILHELFGHGKKRLTNKSWIESCPISLLPINRNIISTNT